MNGIKGKLSRSCLVLSSLLVFGSCAQKTDSALEINIIPKQSIVLEFNAYSCQQYVDNNGIYRLPDGTQVPPAVAGPVVQFNRMNIKWKKSSKLFIHTLQIKFRGAGIAGGEAKCDLTAELSPLFESAAAGNSAIFESGGFKGAGTINSHPRCRVICPLPLADPDVPEISAVGEVIMKASEITNEGTDQEKIYRIRTRMTVVVRP